MSWSEEDSKLLFIVMGLLAFMVVAMIAIWPGKDAPPCERLVSIGG